MNRISIFHNGVHLEFCVTQAFQWDEAAGTLTVEFPAPVMARVFAFAF